MGAIVTRPDPYTMERRLCDDEGLVSHAPVAEPNLFDPALTYLRQINNLRAHTGHPPVAEPFYCTGHAHLAAEHIRCTSPAHSRPFCNTWPFPNSDLDLVLPEQNDLVHKARGCCDGFGSSRAALPNHVEVPGRTLAEDVARRRR